MNKVELVQISHTLDMAFQYPILIQEVNLEEYGERTAKSLLCKVSGVGIGKIEEKIRRVGNVWSFDVVPYKKKDPTIIVCADMDLSLYYEIWNKCVSGAESWNGYDYDRYSFSEKEFEKSIRLAVRSAKMVSKDEVMFAIVEMLSFQNEIMCGY